MTKTERKRAFIVGMVALSKEREVCGISKEEHQRRWRELWHDCFGDDNEPKDLSNFGRGE